MASYLGNLLKTLTWTPRPSESKLAAVGSSVHPAVFQRIGRACFLLLTYLATRECLADYPVFRPSEGRRFGGEFLSNHTASVDACLAALESTAVQQGGMLSRSEILTVVAAMTEAPDDWVLLNFAVSVVQDGGISSDSFSALLRSQLASMGALAGQSRITANVGDLKLSTAVAGIPVFSQYNWVVDLRGKSVLEHGGGAPWSWLPAKAVASNSQVEYTTPVSESGHRSVLVSTVAIDSYRFPEWHPLVSCRYSPPLDHGAVISEQVLRMRMGRDNLRGGYSLFKGVFFQKTELFNGIECYVYGSLDQAVFVDKTDLRRVVGEIDGRGWIDATGKVRLADAGDATIRANSDFSDCSGVFVPASTTYRFCDNRGEVVGSIHVESELCTPSKPSADFKPFEPYLRVDSQGSAPVGVTPPKTVKQQSKWSVFLWVQAACVVVVFAAMWIRKPRA